MMFTIENAREPYTIPDPVNAAQGSVDFGLVLLGDALEQGIQLVAMRELTLAACGAGRRKKSSLVRNRNTVEIRRYLGGRAEAVFQPHAEAVLQTCMDDRTLQIDAGNTPDALAMLPASHIVVVASLRTDLGASLLDGRVDLTYDIDGNPAIDARSRVQRANGLDVLAVLFSVILPGAGA